MLILLKYSTFTQFIKIKAMKIIILQSDITKLKVDAIVNAAKTSIANSGVRGWPTDTAGDK